MRHDPLYPRGPGPCPECNRLTESEAPSGSYWCRDKTCDGWRGRWLLTPATYPVEVVKLALAKETSVTIRTADLVYASRIVDEWEATRVVHAAYVLGQGLCEQQDADAWRGLVRLLGRCTALVDELLLGGYRDQAALMAGLVQRLAADLIQREQATAGAFRSENNDPDAGSTNGESVSPREAAMNDLSDKTKTLLGRAIARGKEGAANGAGYAAGKEIRDLVLAALPGPHADLILALPEPMQILAVSLIVDAVATYAPIPGGEFVVTASEAAIAGSVTMAVGSLDLKIFHRIGNIGRRLAGQPVPTDPSDMEAMLARAVAEGVRQARSEG